VNSEDEQMSEPWLAPPQHIRIPEPRIPSKRAQARQKRLSPDEGYLLRILTEAQSPLFPSQVTERANYELLSGDPFTMTEVAMRLMSMDNSVDQLSDGSWSAKASSGRQSLGR
jgi:hypothetical protein